MTLKKRMMLNILILSILFVVSCKLSNAAPSGSIGAPSGSVEGNLLELNGQEIVTVIFKNTAGGSLDDVASTIQYITLAAANLNPTRVKIDPLTATWEIYSPGSNTPRTSGTVNGEIEDGFYSPYSTTQTVQIYTWKIGPPSDKMNAYTSPSEFKDELRVLRPGETIKLMVNVACQGIVGDSMFWFFFKATEAHYTKGNYPTDINTISEEDRMNLYYSKIPKGDNVLYWLPLHNSYDPYDADIGTGHNFEQHSWTRGPTTRAFAKASKLVHQKPPDDPPAKKYSFHICGIKFNDLNRNGVYEADIEHGIGLILNGNWIEAGVKITLLGPDKKTKAEEYYLGDFNYPNPEENPLYSGENGLRGSYCFNLENVNPEGGVDKQGTYEFWVKIEELNGREATTPTLIGPIILRANDEGPYESINNHFGNSPPSTRPPYVGGEVYSVNKLVILAPYLALISLASIIAIAVKRRKH